MGKSAINPAVVGKHSTDIAALKNDLGIVEDGDTATHTIAQGQYVIWQGALYTADAAIASGTTLAASGGNKNLTAVENGGLNALNGKLTQYSSTEEIEVGTWIDGKKIYRKVFSGVSGSSTGSIVISTGGIYPTAIVKFQAFLYSSGNDWIAVCPTYSGTDTSKMIKVYWDNNGIQVNNSVSSYTSKRIVVVAEYVKD